MFNCMHIPLQIYGSTLSSWTSTTLQDMGSLAGGLSTSQIGQLQLTSIDAVYSMGKHNVYSMAQVRIPPILSCPLSSCSTHRSLYFLSHS